MQTDPEGIQVSKFLMMVPSLFYSKESHNKRDKQLEHTGKCRSHTSRQEGQAQSYRMHLAKTL